jgi:hypothetical protein
LSIEHRFNAVFHARLRLGVDAQERTLRRPVYRGGVQLLHGRVELWELRPKVFGKLEVVGILTDRVVAGCDVPGRLLLWRSEELTDLSVMT